MTCRDGLHPSICLPPTNRKTDIKKRHSAVWFVLNPKCLFPLYVIYRDCYESRHSIPCMFFHYNCRSSELKNNTWNIRCLEGQMCIRIRVRKGNSLGQYWNHHLKKKALSMNAYHKSDHHSKLCLPTQHYRRIEVSERVLENTPLSESGCYMYTGYSWTATPRQAGMKV